MVTLPDATLLTVPWFSKIGGLDAGRPRLPDKDSFLSSEGAAEEKEASVETELGGHCDHGEHGAGMLESQEPDQAACHRSCGGPQCQCQDGR